MSFILQYYIHINLFLVHLPLTCVILCFGHLVYLGFYILHHWRGLWKLLDRKSLRWQVVFFLCTKFGLHCINSIESHPRFWAIHLVFSFLSLFQYTVLKLHIIIASGQQRQSLALVFRDPNLLNNQQLNKNTEVGEREGFFRENKKEMGKQFIALCLPAHGWISLGWIAGKRRLKRGRGGRGSLWNDQTLTRHPPPLSMHKASNQTPTILATFAHPHTYVAMLKKKKNGESSEPCVKKVRRKDRIEAKVMPWH